MNEYEFLATFWVQADGLDGKDAEGTKQLRKVWDRSPNPAPDFFDLFICLSGDKLCHTIGRLGPKSPGLFFLGKSGVPNNPLSG